MAVEATAAVTTIVERLSPTLTADVVDRTLVAVANNLRAQIPAIDALPGSHTLLGKLLPLSDGFAVWILLDLLDSTQSLLDSDPRTCLIRSHNAICAHFRKTIPALKNVVIDKALSV